tara:strand:- start:1421 stop:2641 length:1221 start_codon:yes stop_codon:yes gene_type:complete
LPRQAIPVVAYFLFSLSIYIYSIFGHDDIPIALALIGARGDLFYVPIAILMIYSLSTWGFHENLFRLVASMAILNIIVACAQIFLPDLTNSIPGLHGLDEEGIFSQKGRSFGNTILDYIYGIFGTVAKFTRNMLHIFIWIIVLHLVFRLGKQWQVLSILFIMGPILALSGKRLPALIWLLYVTYIPLVIFFASSLIGNKKTFKRFNEDGMISLRNKFVFTFLMISISVTIFLVLNQDFIIYAEMFLYIVTNEIHLRFFAENVAGYFFQAELNSIKAMEALFGQGAGTSSIGTQYVMSEADRLIMDIHNVEHGPLKVWLEFGVLGLIQMAILALGIAYLDFQILKRTVNYPRLFVATNIISLYHFSVFLSFFVGHSYWSDVQIQIHFWMLTGLQIWIGSIGFNKLTD